MTESTPRIDVIVPVYNAADYLPRCMDSLLAQDFSSYTVTLVDDGSTDGSGALCDRLAAAHPGLVRVLRQANAGPSSARNNAVRRSEAACVCFVDADDRVSENYLSALYRAAEAQSAPIAMARPCREYPQKSGGLRQVMYPALDKPVLDRYGALAESCYDRYFGCFPWGRLLRRDIALANPYPPGRIFEDSFAAWRQIMASERVAYAPEAVYYYLQRADSLQHSRFDESHMDLMDAVTDMMDWFREAGMPPAVLDAGTYKACRACYVTAFHAAGLPLGQFREICGRVVPVLRRYYPPARMDRRTHLGCRLLLTSRTLFYLAARLMK